MVEGVSGWADLESHLKAVPDRSLPAIVLSGHGSAGNGGVATADGSHMYAGNMPDSERDLIKQKLKPDGRLIILGCSQGRYATGMRNMATKIGRPVIGNTGLIGSGNMGDGKWVEFPGKKK
jgi:hypothetical protein